MSNDNFERDIEKVRSLTPEEMPAFPHQGHSLIEEKLIEARTIKPIVNAVNADGSIPASSGSKLIDKEQLELRMKNQDSPYSEKNPEYTDIGPELPSCMAFYPGNSLSIRTFKTPHIIKMIESMEMEDFSMMVEVVSSVIEPGFPAYVLTVEDFFYIMYWLKIHSFKKHPMEIPFQCNDSKHISDVIAGVKTKESLSNKHRISQMGSLTIEYITEEKLNKATEILNRVKKEYGVDLFPMQIKDYILLQDYLKKTALYSTKIAELELLMATEGKVTSPQLDRLREEKNRLDATYAMKDYAPYILLKPESTIIDKLNFLNNADLGPDFLFEVDEFVNVTKHGVIETVAVGCQECKAKMEIDISIDALHFFPEIIRAKFT